MDREIIYPFQQPAETDLLNAQKFAMLGLAQLAGAVLGAGPYLQGLGCTPGTGLTVSVAAGQIYQTAAVDATAFSSLASDSRQVLKQGNVWTPTVLSCPAPGTVGQSINYLVEVGFQENDTGSTVLPFYNASNPAVPYVGPNNSGTPSNTIRSDVCVVQVKAGTAAATGTQTTPAVDSGFVAAYVVTVANGASSIVSGNITLAASAPFLNLTLPNAAPLASPTFSGTPTVPTPAPGDSSLKAINSAFLVAALATALYGVSGPTYVNSAITVAPGAYMVDTSAGPVSLTLPVAPAKGACITFFDPLATWGINNFTLLRNGKNIMGFAQDLIANVSDIQFSIWYNGTEWRLV